MADRILTGHNTADGWRPLAAGDRIVDVSGNPFVFPSSNVPNTLVSTAEGRLTAQSGVPVVDQSSVGIIYYTPYYGDKIAIYNGTAVQFYTFTEIAVALTTQSPFQAYDVFIYDNSGTLAIELLEWANASVTMTSASPAVFTWTAHGLATGNSITFEGFPGTGVSAGLEYFVTVTGANTFKISTSLANVAAGTFVNSSGTGNQITGHSPTYRQTAVTFQNGSWYKSGANTRRWLGTIVMNAIRGGTQDNTSQRLIINGFNRVQRSFLIKDTTATWAYTLLTWRQVRAQDANAVAFICPNPALDDYVELHARGQAVSTAGVRCASGIGIDSTNANSAQVWGGSGASANLVPTYADYSGRPGLGFHMATWLEISTASGTTTWDGNPTAAAQTGVTGFIMG